MSSGNGKRGGSKLQQIGEAFALEVKPQDWYDRFDGEREILEVSVPAEFVEKFRKEIPSLEERLVKEFASATVLHLAVLGIKVVASRIIRGDGTDEFTESLIEALQNPLIIKL